MKRLLSTALFVMLGYTFCQAQWTRQDSIRLQQMLSGDQEIKLNEKAVKDIQLEIRTSKELLEKELLLDDTKNILNFDMTLPRFHTVADSLLFKPRTIYLSLRPYGINGFAEFSPRPYPYVVRDEVRKKSERPSIYNEAFLAQPGIAGRVNRPIGIGFSVSFSAEDLLQYLFSKKGRARLHNAKHAKAWKTY